MKKESGSLPSLNLIMAERRRLIQEVLTRRLG
jgi:hypothetical protein